MKWLFLRKAANVIGLGFLLCFSATATQNEGGASKFEGFEHVIEPTHEFPRNSEGAFITLQDGSVLFCYTQFYGGTDDHSQARLVKILSKDQGRTWSKPNTVLENQAGCNVMSVSLLRLKQNRMALFYLEKNSLLDCIPYVRFSDDEGETWSDPVRMIAAPGYFVLNNDRVIQTEKGRLIAPLAYHRSRGMDPNSYKSFDGRAIALWVYSDDEGKTWKEAGSWWAIPVSSQTGLQEPGVIQLNPGSLRTYFRTDTGVFYTSDSTNDGLTWSAPIPSQLKTPVSPMSLKPLAHSQKIIAVYNDHSGAVPFTAKKRTPLVAALSADQAQSWGEYRVLESDPDGWYCYTAIHVQGEQIYLAYCAGDSKVGGLNRLKIRVLPLASFP